MKKITLCADDYGQNQSISQGIIALFKKNRLSATSCMTTSPLWPSHAEWLKPLNEEVDIGLHFNLTEGSALSSNLLNSHDFLPLASLILKAYRRKLDINGIEAELHAQLDAFEKAMGRSPDFLDGHQHIHQLPMIRDVLLKVYEKRLRASGCYVRSVYDAKAYFRLPNKAFIIQLLGARTFKKMLLQSNIPHNSSFSGVYSFNHAAHYSRIFPRFLKKITDGGIIMCHPGLLPSHTDEDAIAKARYQEFLYFESDDFVLDCFRAGVALK